MSKKLRRVVVNILFTLAISIVVAASLLAMIYGVGTVLSLLFHTIVGG